MSELVVRMIAPEPTRIGYPPPWVLSGGAARVIAVGGPMRGVNLLATGGGVIAGTVTRKADPANLPLRRRVILIEERSMAPVGETWSSATDGGYRFDGLNVALRFTVIAYDHEHTYRAVIADHLAPEPAA